jgi:chromosome partitioning protein
MATDGVIIPMQCEYCALEVVWLTQTIDRLTELNAKLYIRGVVRTHSMRVIR